ncbi:MAG TPA: gamma-glutamyltransferase [Deltaproteobacteria bacterium]|nr:gamma-glutamyltransferase [Deltaproteobacteria bacterium]
MGNFSWAMPYASRRMPIFAENMVATSQPLAAQAGLRMLQNGGNAVDAALATAITLTVVEPVMNGIGSDAFCILWDGEQLRGLNASGRAPASWTPERFSGFEEMPQQGWEAITVPGCVSAWVALSKRFGCLHFEKLFEPAIHYAKSGFQIGPVSAGNWEESVKILSKFEEFRRVFLPKGRAPRTGERFQNPEQAKTLQIIAETNGEAFYRGVLAEQIIADSTRHGGAMNLADLDQHQCDWVDTISQEFMGYELHEIPPNSQGLAALIALGIMRYLPIQSWPVDSAESLHVQIEAMKLALADAYRYFADPSSMDVNAENLLNEDYLKQRSQIIDLSKAQEMGFGVPKPSGTVYLTAADQNGMMVSYIQSNRMGFGSGIVVPGTGISLQNRAVDFNLKEGHPNQVGGGKRPFHTIIPAFLMKDGQPEMSFGVMGGPMQAQGHVQLVLRMLVYGQNPQTAVDGPRWQVLDGLNVAIEEDFSANVLSQLESRGHQLQRKPRQPFFGGAQLIYRMEDGYCGASEPRKEGQAVGF